MSGRVIKFRAWVGELKHFLYTDDGRGFCFCLHPVGGDFIEDANRHTVDSEEWQQFTGLKDKNGVEIYEGDIVEIIQSIYPRTDKKWRGVVIWEEYSFNGAGFYFSHFDCPMQLFSEGTQHIKRLGNIHENPELLEKINSGEAVSNLN